jgi:hypothetical protein
VLGDETTKPRQIGRHRRNAHHCALSCTEKNTLKIRMVN